MTGLFTFYIVWTQRILDRGRPSCLDGGWLTTCLFTWPGCAATISSRTHRFWPVRLSVSCRMSLYHLAIVWTYLYCICVFRDVNIDDTKCWADTISSDGLNCYKTETKPRHVLIKRRKPQKLRFDSKSRLWRSAIRKFSIYGAFSWLLQLSSYLSSLGSIRYV